MKPSDEAIEVIAAAIRSEEASGDQAIAAWQVTYPVVIAEVARTLATVKSGGHDIRWDQAVNACIRTVELKLGGTHD